MSEDYSGPKILIVDDMLANIMLLEKMLKIFGYSNIESTQDPREVINLYSKYQPDLLLLDIKMPFVDGFQVMEKLNEIKGDDYLPIIVITSEDDKENRIRALELGAKDFISKPFDTIEVNMRIKNMLEMRLLHNKDKEQNKILEDKVIERTKDIEELQIELIQRLLKAAEFRDNETGAHISRIGHYAYELGKLAGLDEKICKILLYASMMHDIGKIGIPDGILLKPGKLDGNEWQIMKTHTTKGAEILKGSKSELIKMAEIIALTHHEKWDGTGYPKGLKGEEIPLVGRITAICDVFDALFSERPYKEAWPIEVVVDEINAGSGTHFDALLVEEFLGNLQTFVKIKEIFH